MGTAYQTFRGKDEDLNKLAQEGWKVIHVAHDGFCTLELTWTQEQFNMLHRMILSLMDCLDRDKFHDLSYVLDRCKTPMDLEDFLMGNVKPELGKLIFKRKD